MSHSENEAANRITDTLVALFMDQNEAEPAQDPMSDFGATGVRAGEGAAQGAVSGGIMGGAMGLLGSLFLPDVSPAVVGGLAGTVLAAATLGGAMGALIGALVNLDAGQELKPNHSWQGKDRRGLLSLRYPGPDRRLSPV
jgi:MFS family permease